MWLKESQSTGCEGVAGRHYMCQDKKEKKEQREDRESNAGQPATATITNIITNHPPTTYPSCITKAPRQARPGFKKLKRSSGWHHNQVLSRPQA